MERFCGRLDEAARPSPSEEAKVASILSGVRTRGDKALLQYARRLDGFKAGQASEFRVAASEIKASFAKAGRDFVRAAQNVRARIEAFQRQIRASSWKRQVRPGVTLGQSVKPMRRVGIYVPGGQAPLASTVLMAAVPAKVAGVANIALCTPNRGKGVDARILAAADIAGVTEIYQIGGAHAVAAMAWGTQSLPKVDKIVGPGSRWVNLAKKMVYGQVGIDSLAGPSEAMILADDSASAEILAADLLSQAEHSGHETAVLLCLSETQARKVSAELKRQLKVLPRRAEAESSLKKRGWIAVLKNAYAALEIINARGPEHLQLMLRGAESWLPKVRSAGAIFLGLNTPVALGDFSAGPSHILPTDAAARFSSGLSVEDFVTKSSIIAYSRAALEAEAADVAAFALAEGLEAHGRSVSIRLKRA
jgi:histidinol dehydrogenase